MKIQKNLFVIVIVILISLIFCNFFPMAPWAKIYENFSGKEIDPLCNFRFHQSFLPDSIVSLTSGYAVIVDKRAQKLYVYGKRNNRLHNVYETRCSTGKNQGDKLTSGDSRTPEGIFFPTKKFTKDQLTPIYGILAFNLDYPNYLDKKTGKNGYNIWIHGTDKPLKSFQSNGCIVLDNRDIVRLADFIYLNKTPVIIVDSIKWVSRDSALSLKNEIESAMKSWKNNVIAGTENAGDYIYIIHSAGEKVSTRQFVKQMNHLQNLNRHFSLEPKDISILKQNDHAVVLFDQIISVEDNVFQGVYMKLFLEKRKDQWLAMKDSPQAGQAFPSAQLAVYNKSTSEQSSASNQEDSRLEGKHSPEKRESVAFRPDKTAPTISVATVSPVPAETGRKKENGSVSAIDEKAVSTLISRWVKSWESGNMSVYRDCYSRDFKSRNMDLKRWIKYKEGLNRRYKVIRILVQNIDIKVDAEHGRASARFTQKYTAPGMNDSGTKELHLKKIEGSWKIHRERMIS